MPPKRKRAAASAAKGKDEAPPAKTTKARRKIKVRRKHQLYHQTQVQLVGLQCQIEKEKGSVHIAHVISMSVSHCQ